VARVPVTNNTAMPIYVGVNMIPGGETRHFEESDVPEHLRPAPAPEPAPTLPPDPLVELAGKGVKEIVEAIPSLSTADLERVGELEQAKGEGARKTLLSAMVEALLKRAEADSQA
jgi:hypothetical protein